MSRIFISGSSDGIGLAAAELLSKQGHSIYLHARNQDRARQIHAQVPNAQGVLIGDLTSIADTKRLAKSANDAGPWDCVVHNAGVMGDNAGGFATGDGMNATFQINSLAPYILTCLMDQPKRLLYVSSSLHSGGDDSLKDVVWKERPFRSHSAYADTKLQNILLANATARYWTGVQSCSLDPGWVKTKLAGAGAPGSTSTPAVAIADFASGQGSLIGDRTGVYFNPSGLRTPHRATREEAKQDEYLRICEQLSGVAFPK